MAISVFKPGGGTGDFEFPATDGTAGQALVTNGAGALSFATMSLPDGAIIGGVMYFNRPTKPTERSAGVPLVVRDRWYNTSDGTEWFWNGTYWLGETQYARFPGLLKGGSYTLTNGSVGLLDNGGVTVVGLTTKSSIFVDGFYFCLSGSHTGTLNASNKFSIRVAWRSVQSTPYVVDSLDKFNNTSIDGKQTRYVQLNSAITPPPGSGGISNFTFVISDVTGSPTLSTGASWNQANIVYREVA